MRPVEITRPGVPERDDPQVTTAMRVWKALTADEQAELFCWLYRTVIAYDRTKDADHLTQLADSIGRMVRLESTTNLRQRIRAQRTAKPEPANPADIERLLAQLENPTTAVRDASP